MAKVPLPRGWPTLGKHPHTHTHTRGVAHSWHTPSHIHTHKGGGPLLADTLTHTSTHSFIKIFVQRVQGTTYPCHIVRATCCTVTR